MNPAETISLKDTLTEALPSSFSCKVRYIHTPPKRSEALFSPPPGHDPETTRLSSHFLTVSVPKPPTSDVLVLGIEALIYHTKSLTTIFVSKADSTGYLPQQRPSPVRSVATAFLRWLAAKERRKHPKRELVISLFARSQSQYLFPGSAENGGKHVLDDRQLIKWWAKVLDPLFAGAGNGLEYDGYVTVPGYEGVEVKQFFPPSSQGGQRWHPGNPLDELAQSRGLSKDSPTRCLLPRFPDDPKARFMTDLDDEAGFSDDTLLSPSKRRGGKWKAIWNLDRFWEAMEFRQECSSGRMVGFLWLVIRDPEARRKWGEAKANGVLEENASQESLSDLPREASASQPKGTHSATISPKKPTRRKPLSGPIIPRQPRLKGGSSSLTGSSGLETMLGTSTTSDGLILTREGYDQAVHTLLHLDFANLDVAVQSTAKWVKQVQQTSGIQTDFGMEITGTAAPAVAAAAVNGGSDKVNDLGGMVRKKRKAENYAVVEERTETAGAEKPAVNLLGGGMVRKKAKPQN